MTGGDAGSDGLPGTEHRPAVASRRSSPRGPSPWRRVADVARVTAVVSVPLAFAVSGTEGALRFALVFLVLLAPRVLNVPGPVDAAFAAALLVAAWAGAAGWYDAAWWVDVVVHFSTTGITAAATYLMLVHLGVLVRPDVTASQRQRSRLVLLVVALGLAIGAVWEMYEWVARNWLGNTSIHVGYDDTILDLTMDGLGSLAVALVLVAVMPRLQRRSPEHGNRLNATADG